MIGIYKIENKENGKVYIGKSNDITQRWKQHIDSLESNSHANARLQKDWNSYKINCFDFSILQLCSKDECLELEQYYINKYFNLTDIYNSQIKELDNNTKVAKKVKEKSNILNKPNVKGNYIYKSYDLIMSSYELSLMEYRLIALCSEKILNLYDLKFNTFSSENKFIDYIASNNIEMSVSEFKKEFNISSNNLYNDLGIAISKLKERKIKYFKDTKLSIKKWVSSAEFKQNSGIILIQLDENIISDLLFKNNIIIDINLIKNKCSSKNAPRLYEILKANLKYNTLKLSIEELKFILRLFNKYNLIGDFMKNVIKPCIEYINKYSDIKVSYKTIRSGREIKWIEFNIKKN